MADKSLIQLPLMPQEVIVNDSVRGVYLSGILHVSIIDAYRASGESANPQRDWAEDLKLLRKQGYSTELVPYQFTRTDGKKSRPTPVVTDEQLARIAQITKFTQWEHLRQEMASLLIASRKARQPIPVTQSKPFLRAEHSGYTADEAKQWVDIRQSQRKTYPILTGEWKRRGAQTPRDYARLNNAVSEATIGETTAEWRERTGVQDTPRNHVSGVLNLAIELTQQFAVQLHRDRNSQGVGNLVQDILDAGDIFDHEKLRQIACEKPLQLPAPKLQQRQLKDGEE